MYSVTEHVLYHIPRVGPFPDWDFSGSVTPLLHPVTHTLVTTENAQDLYLFSAPKILGVLTKLSCLILFSPTAEYKTRSVCENEELKLHCKESKFLNIYSASYGRFAQERNICSTEMGHLPQFGRLKAWRITMLQTCPGTANSSF